MKLWKLSQTDRIGRGTYDSAVVAAESEDLARTLHPSQHCVLREQGDESWAISLSGVKCLLVGDAIDGTREGVICASFND